MGSAAVLGTLCVSRTSAASCALEGTSATDTSSAAAMHSALTEGALVDTTPALTIIGGDVGVSATAGPSSAATTAAAVLGGVLLGLLEGAVGLGLRRDVAGGEVRFRAPVRACASSLQVAVAAVERAGEALLACPSLELPGCVNCG